MRDHDEACVHETRGLFEDTGPRGFSNLGVSCSAFCSRCWHNAVCTFMQIVVLFDIAKFGTTYLDLPRGARLCDLGDASCTS